MCVYAVQVIRLEVQISTQDFTLSSISMRLCSGLVWELLFVIYLSLKSVRSLFEANKRFFKTEVNLP